MKQLAQSILRWGSYPLVFGGSARRRGGFGNCPRIIAFTLALCDTCLWAGPAVESLPGAAALVFRQNGL